MPKVLLMEFDGKERIFRSLKEIEVLQVPTKGDKIVINDDEGIGHIFDVYDVHYTDGHGAEVNAIRISTIREYEHSKYLDIA